MRLIENMPSNEYHAAKGVSASLLKAYAVSAAHGRSAELGTAKRSDEAMAFGSACHSYVLEPEVFSLEYAMKPDGMSFATKEGKEWRAKQAKKIVSYDDAEAFSGMRKSLLDHPVAGPFLRAKGRGEVSAFSEWKDGTPIRARFDKLTDDGVILDLKTTQSARPRDFIRQCFYLGWHIQAAWYSSFLAESNSFGGFVFLAVEKEPPYVVLCAELDDMSIQKGREEYTRLMELRAKCHKEQRWPGYVDQETPYLLTLPAWALNAQEPSEQITYQLNS